MGTDIHALVQRRTDAGWETVSPELYNYAAPGANFETIYRGKHPASVLKQRNYSVFAVLSNVRNGRGFAGVYTNDAVRPIQPKPRGIPDDCDIPPVPQETIDEYAGESWQPTPQDHWLGEHTYGWVSLRELLDYEWGETVRVMGCLTPEQYSAWDRTEPKWWNDPFEGIFGGSTRNIVDEDVYRQSLSGWRRLSQRGSTLEWPKCEVRVEWTRKVRDHMTDFVDKFIPWLQTLGDPDNVRVVMGYDS